MWGEVIKASRTFSRLVWFHVPPRMTSSGEPTHEEVQQAIAEKKAALGLIEGYAVALKHHLRGETGLYYADLYYLTVWKVIIVKTHRMSLTPFPALSFLSAHPQTLRQHL